MIFLFGCPGILSKSETKELRDLIEFGGKYILFEYPPNHRRLENDYLTICNFVTIGGIINEVCYLYGGTAMSLIKAYNSGVLRETNAIHTICNQTDGYAYLIEDIIKNFGYNEEKLRKCSKTYREVHEKAAERLENRIKG